MLTPERCRMDGSCYMGARDGLWGPQTKDICIYIYIYFWYISGKKLPLLGDLDWMFLYGWFHFFGGLVLGGWAEKH